jgi:hypothetical protein
MAAPHRVCWPHAPFHELSARGTYILTGGTYKKQHYFRTIERLRVLHRGLLSVAQDFGWRLKRGLCSRITITLSDTLRLKVPIISQRCLAFYTRRQPSGSIRSIVQLAAKFGTTSGKLGLHIRTRILQDSTMSIKTRSNTDWFGSPISIPGARQVGLKEQRDRRK